MKQRKLPGCINAAQSAYCYNKQGVIVGRVLCTPNAIAYAMANHRNIYKVIKRDKLFGDEIYMREDMKDRFPYVKDNEALKRYYIH